MLANLIYSFVHKAPSTRPARPLYSSLCVCVCECHFCMCVMYFESRGPYGIDESVIYKRAYKPQIQFALPKLQLAKHLQCNFRLTAKQATYDYFPALGPEWLLPRGTSNNTSISISTSTGTSTNAGPSSACRVNTRSGSRAGTEQEQEQEHSLAECGIRDVFSSKKPKRRAKRVAEWVGSFWRKLIENLYKLTQ